MRVLAASFLNEATAAAALTILNHRFRLGGSFLSAPLSQAGDPTAPTTLLAGSFADDAVTAVRGAVEELGGTVVADVDERVTHR